VWKILSSPLDIDGFFAAVGAHGVNQLVSCRRSTTQLCATPTFRRSTSAACAGLLRRRADRESLVHAIKEAFPNARVGNGFGLTETSSLTSFLPHEEARARRFGALCDTRR